jgi:suppressor for copper-sensitivity B
MSNYLRVILLFLIGVLAANPSLAASSSWVATEVGQIRLIGATDKLGEGQEALLGLEFTLKKGWKIYWRSPGFAGYAPKLDWTGSTNLGETEIFWPTPERFTILGIETVGYKGEIVLPLKARPQAPDQGLNLKLNLDFLACSDICVPVTADLALTLPAGEAGQAALEAQLINRFQARVPGDGQAQGMKLVQAQWIGAKTLVVEAEADPAFNAPDLFVEGPEGALFSAPKVTLEERGHKARLEVALVESPKSGLAEQMLILTLADGIRGMEASLIPSQGTAPKPARASLWGMIGLALLGGLILNLMPCVLPVLSLKILGLIGHGGAERARVRFSFIASAAGILASFLVLGLAALTLKLSGSAVGWGLQFQEPMFLSFLAALVVLFAANMAGFYEIGIPHWLGGQGRELGHPHGLAQHFLAGMFATLLATPCSAPFLGTAVGFALAAGPLEIVVIFLCLGLGMAGPYLLVAAWPQMASRMPKPGAWMITLRRWLALALAGTSIWLLWVIDSQTGRLAALAVFALLAATALLLFLRHRTHRALLGWLALALALLAIPAPRLLPTTEAKTQVVESYWLTFDEAAIPRLVSEGKVVFVDVTADWCVTCQVNKRLVLDQEAIRTLLTAPDLVAMKADWTKPDAVIGAYLAKFGRFGIPFNAVYGPGAPDGIALPELLSAEAVMQAIKAAKAP